MKIFLLLVSSLLPFIAEAKKPAQVNINQVLFAFLAGEPSGIGGGGIVFQKKGFVECVAITKAAPRNGPTTHYKCRNELNRTMLGEVSQRVMASLNVEPETLTGGGSVVVTKQASVDCLATLTDPYKTKYYCNSGPIKKAK